ncbi:hypothetical protein A5746_10265 [Mycolicibacterium conceptionense]|uniref:hypothetical protein n=1 Tax=Mycolicibacterium conceptionense TaxID=451644 RepID=UPI0007ECCA30|nr:hypothetical protein [Mycolicibacterium conceptionense]OBK04673.1 hypothetical protein A5639_20585 [Mycolicibacterium conceptionense]OMB90348.1 hypothetical protein A5741_12270 [Mycolicibacterium conceptionense]OMC02073.1 hypothetical protein A5746_10265 [Mycolicibacterium conceptionense]
MNACEDETEPMGESPAIDTLGAINRAAEIGMLSPADKVTATTDLADRQDKAINAVRALHYTITSNRAGKYCHECLFTAPCPTISAIDEASA